LQGHAVNKFKPNSKDRFEPTVLISFIKRFTGVEIIFYSNTKCESWVKVSDAFSGWQTVGKGVPQGSGLGPMFFNIFSIAV